MNERQFHYFWAQLVLRRCPLSRRLALRDRREFLWAYFSRVRTFAWWSTRPFYFVQVRRDLARRRDLRIRGRAELDVSTGWVF